MRKAIVALAGLVAAAVALTTVPAVRDEIQWQWVSYEDRSAGYQSYLQAWPAGQHADAARARLDDLAWRSADLTSTVAAYQTYIEKHPQGRHVGTAQARLDGQGWAIAERANTIKAYQTYIAAYPQGRFTEQARGQAAALRSNEALYEGALQTGREDSLVAFLDDYPGHVSEAAAREALREIRDGLDIVDLLNDGKIEVQAQGNGISNVFVRLRRLVPRPLTVRIPVGSYFVSANPSAQNMVTTAEKKLRLVGSDWQSVVADAACANRPKRVPKDGDTFSVQRSPHQAELARLMPVLDKARVDYKTRQAAVWIVTDNATYNELGVLIASRSGFGGSRIIKEKEAAQAVRICHQAGIDVNEKAIQKDYRRIISALEAGDLKSWLEGMAAIGERKERDRDIARATKAIEKNPSDGQAYTDRGAALYLQGGGTTVPSPISPS